MTEDLPALILQAYDCYESVGYVDLIDKILECDAVKVFDAAFSLSVSENTKERVLAAEILKWFNCHKNLFRSEVVDILIKLLEDADDDVVYAAVYALSFEPAQKAVPALLKLIEHHNEFLRECLTGALNVRDDDAIAGLITLSRDENVEVRSWAVFRLVRCSNEKAASKEITKALKARLYDDTDITGEAILGLVKRGDKTLADRILSELQSSEIDRSIIEAAGLVGGADHKAALLSLKGKLKDDEVDYYGYDIDLAISQLS